MAYWLLKSEPSAYSYAQLVKDKRTRWDGIRNFQAANNLKAMKKGDRCFFYHSNEGLEIVGIVEVVKEAHPDPKDATGRFVMIEIAAVKPLKKQVTLATLKADPKFKDLMLVTHSRLSVSPVSEPHWNLILKMGETT
ncbi:MAG: EVE domain-containing protein [Rhodospirillaceae bacterium]|nr:EVE domain-containing protein [Rhodospirillaceae bacterium]